MAATAAPRTHTIFKVKAAGRTRLIVFDTQDLTLGRAPENDIAVDDPEMSRRHAVFKRSREGTTVEDMGTSNGTAVNGQVVARAVLAHGDVVRIGEVEITYAETTRVPSSLGSSVEYASQIKSFRTPIARMQGDAEATILGIVDAPASTGDEDFEVRPAGEFDFGLHEAGAGQRAPRDLDAEVADLELDSDFAFGAQGQAPARKAAASARNAKADVWELEDAPAEAAAGPLAITLEIDGLSGDLRRWIDGLVGKAIELPKLRIRIKGRDLA